MNMIGGIKVKILHTKKLIIVLMIFTLMFTSSMTFAYWAKEIFANPSQNSQQIDIGNWFNATPIFSVEEFIEVITTDMNTESYVIAKNLDFENVTPPEWIQTKDIRFMGSINGLNRTLSNINLTDYRGIFGVLEDATIINLHFDNVTINYTTSDTYTSGILAGRLQGTNNLIDNVSISNSSINSTNVLSGGLIGFISPLSGTVEATIQNISIQNTSISGGFNNASYGNGGLIGSINNANLILNNININASVTSSSGANSGGIAGAVIGASTINLSQANIINSTISINGTGSALGAGGIYGLLQGANHSISQAQVSGSSISSASLSGGLIGYATQSSGVLSILDTTITSTNISSSISSTTLGTGGLIAVTDGYETTITNANVSVSVTSSGNSNAGGIIGVSTTSARLILENMTIEDSIVQINGTGTTLGSGGIVGFLQGTNHSFTKSRVINSTISSNSASGGIIGAANQSSGVATIDNAKVKGSAISSQIANNTVGTGGIVGNTLNYTMTLNDLYVEANIQTNNANVGGLVGYKGSGTYSINRAVVYSDLIINNPTNTTDRGAGGVIGRHVGSMTANHVFFTGYLKARVQQNRPYVGTLRAIGTNLTFTNSRSAEIRYFISTSNPNQLVNTLTLYDNMRGQKATYASSYTILRSSLNVSYWTSNYSTITNSPLWEYNATTNLYELID